MEHFDAERGSFFFFFSFFFFLLLLRLDRCQRQSERHLGFRSRVGCGGLQCQHVRAPLTSHRAFRLGLGTVSVGRLLLTIPANLGLVTTMA
jgi:hypothetical protein